MRPFWQGRELGRRICLTMPNWGIPCGQKAFERLRSSSERLARSSSIDPPCQLTFSPEPLRERWLLLAIRCQVLHHTERMGKNWGRVGHGIKSVGGHILRNRATKMTWENTVIVSPLMPPGWQSHFILFSLLFPFLTIHD